MAGPPRNLLPAQAGLRGGPERRRERRAWPNGPLLDRPCRQRCSCFRCCFLRESLPNLLCSREGSWGVVAIICADTPVAWQRLANILHGRCRHIGKVDFPLHLTHGALHACDSCTRRHAATQVMRLVPEEVGGLVICFRVEMTKHSRRCGFSNLKDEDSQVTARQSAHQRPKTSRAQETHKAMSCKGDENNASVMVRAPQSTASASQPLVRDDNTPST